MSKFLKTIEDVSEFILEDARLFAVQALGWGFVMAIVFDIVAIIALRLPDSHTGLPIVEKRFFWLQALVWLGGAIAIAITLILSLKRAYKERS